MERQKLNKYQQNELSYAAEAGIDTKKLLGKNYSHTTMHEIRKGLENGVDITSYNIDKLNYFQLRELRFGLQDGIDVKLLLNKAYTSGQMHELRLGMLAKIDVSKYADPTLTYYEMDNMRAKMTSSQLNSRNIAYCIDAPYNSYFTYIFSLENGVISKASNKTFENVFDAREHLDKMLKVDNFFKKKVEFYGSLSQLDQVLNKRIIKQKLNSFGGELKINANYFILDENETHALAYNPTAPQPFVLWHRENDYYYWGTYHSEMNDNLLFEIANNRLDVMQICDILKRIGALECETLEENNELEM